MKKFLALTVTAHFLLLLAPAARAGILLPSLGKHKVTTVRSYDPRTGTFVEYDGESQNTGTSGLSAEEEAYLAQALGEEIAEEEALGIYR